MKKSLVYILFFLVTSCADNFDKNIIGDYKVSRLNNKIYELNDISLKLNENKSFIIRYKGNVITGNWEVKDNGDMTVVEFIIKSNIITEGVISGKKFDI